MNEMKPEDVMKALKYCSAFDMCENCSYNDEKNNCVECTCRLAKDALALLREKDAERKELWEERMRIYTDLQEWKAECKKYQDACKEKDAEIKGLVDGWSKDQDRFEKTLADKDAKIADLEKEIERKNHILECYALQYGTTRDKEYFLNKARAETITEFAERMKLAAHTECSITGYKYLVVDVWDIDDIAKEMKEGDN